MKKIEEIFKPEYIFKRKEFTKALKKEGYEIAGIRWFDGEDQVIVDIWDTPNNPYHDENDKWMTISIYQPYYE